MLAVVQWRNVVGQHIFKKFDILEMTNKNLHFLCQQDLFIELRQTTNIYHHYLLQRIHWNIPLQITWKQFYTLSKRLNLYKKKKWRDLANGTRAVK